MTNPMQAPKVWVPSLLAVFTLAVLQACIVSHVRREIPPPGGCDRCHRFKISSNWEVAVAPVSLGSEGGVKQPQDIVLESVRQVPYHREVPAKRLEIFASSVEPEMVGDQETGIQCFVCHRSPDVLHESQRGQFHHPWDSTDGARPPQ